MKRVDEDEIRELRFEICRLKADINIKNNR
jgi:hypothetical protein